MATPQAALDFSDFTLNDIHVGTRLYTALVTHAHATGGAPVFYSDILQQARALDANDAELQRAVPIGIGMKLLFVERFCLLNGYPTLACLAVSKARGRPSEGYKGDWEADKQAVAQFDWSTAQAQLDAYVIEARRAVTPRKRRTEAKALDLRYQHFKGNRQAYSKVSDEEAQEILTLLIEGFDADAAYGRVIAARALLAGA
ncbi:hypothetical protein G4G28_13950 [Massilia sp. Dwa41.01b]|uniref:hypothetical protein n=1 Tax=unclassified Massilia TaxID=2609279 RepID=UPI001602068F|nr:MULTISPECIES: hypothetical protein [unclassified Massilia]QNA89292.1 hypothetical protein G4G28_13950 [Massilia sp. Dwa41.01b]QNB00195.1 hypothetical protein G4G31_17530 [Massilia sp. Se16.2.3]